MGSNKGRSEPVLLEQDELDAPQPARLSPRILLKAGKMRSAQGGVLGAGDDALGDGRMRSAQGC